MFTPGRWATAFTNALRQDVEAVGQGLDLLKAISPVVCSIRSTVSGTAASVQLEGMLYAALKAGGGDESTGLITAHFVLLLVKKGLFDHIDRITEKIEEEHDKLRGFLRASLESSSPPDEAFRKELADQIAGKTGAKGVRLDVKIIPELLGGYRLRIGGELIDASLRAQLQKMETDLAAVYIPGKSGGL
jgi:F-type H+-transporting ATPase subunit delta